MNAPLPPTPSPVATPPAWPKKLAAFFALVSVCIAFLDKLSSHALVHLLILVAAIWTLHDAIEHRRVATDTYLLLTGAYRSASVGTQYQNAFTLLDQSAELTDALSKESNLRNILKESGVVEAVEVPLEKYQLILFKGAVLKENNLTPPEFWRAFVEDFCDLYEKYPYIQGWWARQKTREPYSSLSSRYTDLNHECVSKSGEAFSPSGGAEWKG